MSKQNAMIPKFAGLVFKIGALIDELDLWEFATGITFTQGPLCAAGSMDVITNSHNSPVMCQSANFTGEKTSCGRI